MKQGDIVLVDLNPTTGHEQSGVRPAVVVSSSIFSYSGLCIVCPITSVIKHRVGYVLLVRNKENGLKKNSEILTSQIRTISVARVSKKIGKISETELYTALENINLHMGR
ncbi:MAG: type II toxin-antitoxin system PemK/MazF family toxin [Candidatus Taylorbacteria bacterium]|nr:type II toxin-antitoxin system PemK/MazF family toxin [Candidatus Taylorbacteria bacterium]